MFQNILFLKASEYTSELPVCVPVKPGSIPANAAKSESTSESENLPASKPVYQRISESTSEPESVKVNLAKVPKLESEPSSQTVYQRSQRSQSM